jgi:hypothetical protein
MARVQRRLRQNYKAGKAGATQASQEKQDDQVSQGTPPGGNHEDADVNLDIHACDAHDNDDNTDCAENNNSDIAATTNGEDRPDVHGHEGEDVDDDKKEGQAGDQPRTQESQQKQDDGVSEGLPPQENHEDTDANPDSHAHNAHDNNVHSDSAKTNNSDIALATDGEDRPELHDHEGQAGDQSQTQASHQKQDDGVSEGLPPRENHEDADTNPDSHAHDAHYNNVHSDSDSDIALATNGEDRPELHNHEGQASNQLPEAGENNGDNNVEDDINDGDDAVPLEPNISPQFNSKDLYKVLGVSMNTTERQIKSAYFNLAKKHHPDRQPVHLSKDDANITFSCISNAYEILGDTEKRREHDASLLIGKVIYVDGEGNDDEDIDDDNDSDDDGINFDEDRPPEKDRTLFT